MNRPNQFEFEWITDWNEIYSESFQQQWLSWHTAASEHHVFFHPALCLAWIDTYRPLRDIKPMFCIARKNNTLIFIPLVYWKKNWKNAFQRVIIPVGYSDFDYHDPIVNGGTDVDIETFFSELVVQIKNNFSFDKILINGIRSQVNFDGWKQEADICPYCNLSAIENQEAFLKTLKTSLRGDLNRQMRRLTEHGHVDLYTYRVDTLDQALETLPQFLDLHAKRWPQAYKAPGFHRTLLAKGLQAGIVDFTELRVGGEAISWHLGFSDQQRYYYYMPVIHPDYSSLSPGKLHLLFLVSKAIQNKIHIFDHLRGDENYKTGWTNSVQHLYCYTERTHRKTGIIRNWLTDELKQKLK